MYQYGMEFSLLTDHEPQETVYSASSRNSARIERWVLRLQPYKFRVQYVLEKQNIADSLSHLVDKGGLSGRDDADEIFPLCGRTINTSSNTHQRNWGRSSY